MTKPLRVLVLCTGNSARSQIAEALLNWKGKGRFEARSAGTAPAAQVNPLALDILKERGVPWGGHPPRSTDGLEQESWDFVITVCDNAKESCPVLPGKPVYAHWSTPDPAAVQGDEPTRKAAFRDAFVALARRVDLFLALPVERR